MGRERGAMTSEGNMRMRAVLINGKQDIEWSVVNVPEPEVDQVRIRVRYVGICGSDLHYYQQGANGAFLVREPLVPGHELSGIVDYDPKGELSAGTPVTVHPATYGNCLAGLEGRPQLWPSGAYLGSASTWPHTQGAMSEYIVVETSKLRVLPPDLPVRRAALAEPLAVALHGLNLAGEVAGKTVLVSGCGPLGLLAVAATLRAGAARVIAADVLVPPLDRAQELGAHQVINAAAEDLPTEGVDVVLECSGAPAAINSGFVALRRAGVCVQLGIVPDGPQKINMSPVISKELAVFGSFRFSDEIDQAIALLASDPDIERVITHEFPGERVSEAFAVAADSSISSKVLVTF